MDFRVENIVSSILFLFVLNLISVQGKKKSFVLVSYEGICNFHCYRTRNAL